MEYDASKGDGIRPITRAATLAGQGVGYTVRLFRGMRFPRIGWKSGRSRERFGYILRKAILAEVQRSGILLSDREIDTLVEKVIALLEKVLSGQLGIEAIPSVSELLTHGSRLSGFLVPLILGDKELSEKKKEILRRIFEDNVQLRKATKEARAGNEQ